MIAIDDRNKKVVIASLAMAAGMLILLLLVPAEVTAFGPDHHFLWDPLDELWRCLGSAINCGYLV